MMRPAASLAFMLLLMSALSIAQDSCPDGFRFAGTLEGSAAYETPYSGRREVKLPENTMLDTTYQQTKVRAEAGHLHEHSNLLPQDIPAGIHIVPYGKAGDGGWFVSHPELRVVTREANGRITRYAFGMQLYCIPGDTPTDVADCEVNVDVCYKPKM
jgi:hypothetical protein